MKETNTQMNRMILLINIISIIISMISTPDLIIVYLFYLIFGILIYKYFSSNIKRYLYFTILFYASVTSGNSKFIFLFYFIYIIVILYNLFKHKNRISFNKMYNKKYLIFFVIFVVDVVMSVFIAQDKYLSMKTLYRYIIMIALFVLMFLENNSRDKLKETMRFFLVLYVGILFLGTLEIFNIDIGLENIYINSGITYEYTKRIPVTFFYNPNNYAVVLNLGIAMLFTHSLHLKNLKEKIFNYILISISIVNLIFTSSRLGWLTVFLTLLIVFIGGLVLIFQNKNIGKTYIISSIVTSIWILFIFVALSFSNFMYPYYGKLANSVIISNIKQEIFKVPVNNTPEKVPPIKLEYGGEGSENERITLMHDVLEGVIGEKNYLGFGVGNIGKYIEGKGNTNGIVNIHSFWFEYLGDFGIIMFIYLILIYCMMLWDMLIITLKTVNDSYYIPTMLLVVGIIMVILAFSPSTILMFTPFWTILGICFSFVCNWKNEEFIVLREGMNFSEKNTNDCSK